MIITALYIFGCIISDSVSLNGLYLLGAICIDLLFGGNLVKVSVKDK